ncbi:MAG: NDP-sugar synthase [bacterium]|nr:NDP-sugar synthase [bacterium]
MRAFILAGGFATRLWPLTEKRAKPLLPLAGKPLVSHLVEQIPAEVPVTVSTNAALREGFEEWKATMNRPNLTIIVEDTKNDDHKVGALGATAQWIEQESIDDDILLLTGDNYCGFSIPDFLQSATAGVPLVAVHDLQDKQKASAFGTVIIEELRTQNSELRTSNVIGFEEKPKEPKTSLVSTGCSLLPKEALSTVKEYAKQHPDNVGGIFEEFLRRSIPVECYTFSEPWFDIGSFDAYLEASQALTGENVVLNEHVTFENNTCEGSVVIGKGSSVQNSELRNVIVFENCDIDDCILENCIIDNSCILKGIELNGKMLRADTQLTSKL